jgi:hypothetical protein
MRYLYVSAVTVLLTLLPDLAFAQSAWDVLQRFGVTGTWAYPCSKPPSTTNWWTTYFENAAGVARRRADRGPDVPALMVTIDSAEILTSTTMAARFRNDDVNWGQNNGVIFDLIIVKEKGRIRTLSARSSTGQEFIKNGVVVSSNAPAPWLEKCNKPVVWDPRLGPTPG